MRRRRKYLVVGLIGLFALLVAGSPVFAGEPAVLTLAVRSHPDGTASLTATVTDAQRVPVPDVMVTFEMKTTFGWLVVADRITDRSGQATVALPQMPRSGEITAEADAGTKTLHAAIWIDRSPPPAPRTRPGSDTLSALSPQPGFISPYPPAQILFVAVLLGGIWTTYAYLVSLLLRLKRAQ